MSMGVSMTSDMRKTYEKLNAQLKLDEVCYSDYEEKLKRVKANMSTFDLDDMNYFNLYHSMVFTMGKVCPIDVQYDEDAMVLMDEEV